MAEHGAAARHRAGPPGRPQRAKARGTRARGGGPRPRGGAAALERAGGHRATGPPARTCLDAARTPLGCGASV